MSDTPMCDRCNKIKRQKGIKYCNRCKFAVLAEMRRAGYLDSDYIQKQPTEERGRKSRTSSNALGCDYHLDANEEDN